MSRSKKILVVDDEESNALLMKKALQREGLEVVTANTGADGLQLLLKGGLEALVTDVRMPGMSGVELLQEIRSRNNQLPVVVVSGFAEVDSAVRCMQLGALDFLTKPLDLERLRRVVNHALGSAFEGPEESADEAQGLEALLGFSASMKEVNRLISRAAPYDISVLITGESGTGKEVAANAVHQLSARAAGPLVALDCAAIPEHLVESELFGYEKGAFTGAQDQKPGRFEMANGGTLFLDEIGNLNLTAQMKLLRVLQERRIVRLGGKSPVPIDVRLVTATNANLKEMASRGEFREDLYHRIAEIEIQMPPLRDRGEDVEHLAEFFLRRFCAQFGRQMDGFTQQALEWIRGNTWTGNVRELQNCVKRAVVLADKEVDKEHLQPLSPAPEPPSGESAVFVGEGMKPLKEIVSSKVEVLERDILKRALVETRWNKAKAAKWLQVDYKTLLHKLKEYDIS